MDKLFRSKFPISCKNVYDKSISSLLCQRMRNLLVTVCEVLPFNITLFRDPDTNRCNFQQAIGQCRYNRVFPGGRVECFKDTLVHHHEDHVVNISEIPDLAEP